MDHREHSVYFDDYNSWDTWHLVPSSRPTPSIPEVRTNFVTIPGRSGSLDLTEALTGGIVYEDRELEIEFIVLDQEMNWMDVYQDVVSKIHGKRMKIRLVDDPEYYYMGRVTVGEFTSNSDYSSISITCQLEPYKYGDGIITDTLKLYLNNLIIPYSQTGRRIAVNIGKPMTFENESDTSAVHSIGYKTALGSEFLHKNTPLVKDINVVQSAVIKANVSEGVSLNGIYFSLNNQNNKNELHPYFNEYGFNGNLGGKLLMLWIKIECENASDWSNFTNNDYIEIEFQWSERSL